ncbi:MAG: hypothetical protein E5X01_26985 [Mesorhizobium sp.]|nr:MAG: hypothetical protein E5X01_26985 [Mesorhizobium sp.]
MLGEAVRFIKTELAATLTSLSAERDEARSIVRDIHWMAVRYADNRKSYAVGMCNDALRKAYDAGWLKYTGGNDKLDPQYARDGMFDREWVSALDAANARATASEAEASDLRRKLEEARNANGKMHRRAQLAEAINQSVEGILSMWVSVLFGPDGKKTPRYYDYHLFGFALGDIMAQRKKLTARLAASPSAQTDGGGDGS